MGAFHIVGGTWFNSPVMTADDFRGKIILFYFWSYSSIHSLRSLAYVRKWQEEYGDRGLTVIGIHSPQFEFEKNPAYVEMAIKRYQVNFPVVLDNNFINWEAFNNYAWPAFYLMDKDESIILTAIGDENYEEIEEQIRGVLFQSGTEVSLVDIEHTASKKFFYATPELYCGYAMGVLGNHGGYIKDAASLYQMPATMPDNAIVLSGTWRATEEYLESQESEATMHVKFEATEINLVLSPVDEQATVEILLNGQKISPDISGDDVTTESLVTVQESRLYNLFRSNLLPGGIISIKVKEGNVRAYAFTFSGKEQ